MGNGLSGVGWPAHGYGGGGKKGRDSWKGTRALRMNAQVCGIVMVGGGKGMVYSWGAGESAGGGNSSSVVEIGCMWIRQGLSLGDHGVVERRMGWLGGFLWEGESHVVQDCDGGRIFKISHLGSWCSLTL